jgi:hypothetical protein
MSAAAAVVVAVSAATSSSLSFATGRLTSSILWA